MSGYDNFMAVCNFAFVTLCGLNARESWTRRTKFVLGEWLAACGILEQRTFILLDQRPLRNDASTKLTIFRVDSELQVRLFRSAASIALRFPYQTPGVKMER